MQAVSSYTTKPHEPMPDRTAWKPSYDMGMLMSVTTAFATPDNTALIVRPGATPPPTMSMTSPNGVPSSTSATPGRTTSPVTVHTTLPGDSAVPIDRCQSAPCSRIHGTLDSVSTLLTRVGLGDGFPSTGSHPLTMSVANRPCSYGGNSRGRGGLPSITSRRAFSSPYRYSSGPST